jgi:hypothetical protein
MGAHIALTAALTEGGRIDHLVVAGVGGRIFEPPREPGAMAKAMEAASPDEITDPMLKSFRHFADEQKEDRLALAACSRGGRTELTRDALMAIRRPTLVIAGARDQLAGPPQGLADAIAGAKAVTIPGCDHFSMIAHGLFKASVFDFFDGWLEWRAMTGRSRAKVRSAHPRARRQGAKAARRCWRACCPRSPTTRRWPSSATIACWPRWRGGCSRPASCGA